MDDLRLGRTVRVLRHRLRLPQREVGQRSGSSQDLVSRVERGRIERITVGRLRRLVAVFDAELVLFVRWRGGEIDRLLDRAHASLGEETARLLRDFEWEVVAEVSYSEYGERGSIDLLAFHQATSTLLVIEIKSELTLLEETLRRLDAKLRLAPKVALERCGWQGERVARLLVLPDERTPRRRVQLHAALFARGYPLRGRAVRHWLAEPGGAGATTGPAAAGGILFLPSNDGVRPGRASPARRRIRSPRKPV
ncbi:MAG TPA: helix-turn-helix transcriptional regulator [Candidatus Limnocylindrales bacterium]|nr:helix-turn-helix transcriptional regulator [Candidatus Limnocylindrales bacterium]